MTEQQAILTQAIQKAVERGWENEEGVKPIIIEGYVFLTKHYASPNILFDIKELLFDTEFAKALWGPTTLPDYSKLSDEELVRGAAGQRHNGYQYYLQQMVILPDDERIAYLGANI